MTWETTDLVHILQYQAEVIDPI